MKFSAAKFHMSGQHWKKLWRQTGKQFSVTREMLTSVACDQRVQFMVVRCCRWNLSAFFKICFCFVLLYNKIINDWSRRKQWIFFPLNSVEILEKQNPLFPSGLVIYCWMFCSRPQNWLGYYAPPFISVVVFVRSILRMASSALSDAFLSSYTNFLQLFL